MAAGYRGLVLLTDASSGSDVNLILRAQKKRKKNEQNWCTKKMYSGSCLFMQKSTGSFTCIFEITWLEMKPVFYGVESQQCELHEGDI